MRCTEPTTRFPFGSLFTSYPLVALPHRRQAVGELRLSCTAHSTLMGTSEISSRVISELAALFHRNGYVRPPAEKRMAGEGYGRFRRGYEFRLTATSKGELRLIRDLLRQADFKPGRPFTKGRQFRQPVYGRHALERFLLLIDADDAPKPVAAARHGS